MTSLLYGLVLLAVSSVFASEEEEKDQPLRAESDGSKFLSFVLLVACFMGVAGIGFAIHYRERIVKWWRT